MASGKTHALWNSAVLIATAVLVAPNVTLPLAAGAVTGATLGLLITPDIDHVKRTHEENRIYKHGGPVIGWLWVMFWRRYQRTHPHRGNSHKPLTGTLGRWRYMLVRLWPLVLLLLYLGEWQPASVLAFVWACYSFNALQDIVHLILDRGRYHRERKRKK